MGGSCQKEAVKHTDMNSTITEFDKWRKTSLGGEFNKPVSSSKPYGSVVANWNECKNALKTNSDVKQVVYNRSSKACYPSSDTSPDDVDGKGGENTGWISAQKTGGDIVAPFVGSRSMKYDKKVYMVIVLLILMIVFRKKLKKLFKKR